MEPLVSQGKIIDSKEKESLSKYINSSSDIIKMGTFDFPNLS